ncbi:Blue-light photoreceptor PHR2 [Morella rubra]|uniref:Blue-light photoreceptor PHR2 n=1 Tax=Morella rubra TaxID=262757 RepID=A0A6A1UPJ7_9ROSI|nr:Blue-light photoreceptor PHR2 [Morella rubra]
MDSHGQILENPETKSLEEQNSLAIVTAKDQTTSPAFATASLSLSLSTILPTPFSIQPKIYSLFSHQPSKVKVPTQASSLAHLSLSATSPSPSKLSFKSTVSANPLQNPLSLGPRRPSDPSNGAGIRRAAIVWFRNDLRVSDNECLNTANNEAMSVLPVYCFDPRDYGKSTSGFDKTGPYRASFLIESVSDLRKNLQSRGSDLVVRIGKPETVLVELAKAVGADAVYAHREVSHDEVKSEGKIEAAMKEDNVEVKYSWGSTLYHLDDLPFKLEDMPANYGGFREKVQGLEVRKTIEALDQIKGLPARGDVEPGDIPSLMDLGLNPSATISQALPAAAKWYCVGSTWDGKPAANASMVGGETEALQRLKKFAAECQAQPPKGNNDSIYGANFSCKISPWLAMGCLSPRSMFDELKKTATRTISATSNQNDGGSPDSGNNWLMFELLWRDFFRFITKKYSSKQLEAAPATACTGALA